MWRLLVLKGLVRNLSFEFFGFFVKLGLIEFLLVHINQAHSTVMAGLMRARLLRQDLVQKACELVRCSRVQKVALNVGVNFL